MAEYNTDALLAVSAARSGVLVTGVNLVPAPQGVTLSTTGTAVSIAYPQGSAGIELSSTATAVAYLPYVQGVEGSRPIEAKIYDPTGTQVLAVCGDRFSLGWQEDYNDTGSGTITLHKYDLKANEETLQSFNIVKFEYDNDSAFAFRIEKRTLDIVKDGDHQAKVWRLEGRGLLAMLTDAVVYPEYGLARITSKQRNFNFSSKRGPWYVASEWTAPMGFPQSTTGGNPWEGWPEAWPDAGAEWIWFDEPWKHHGPETVFFRSEFNMAEDGNVTIFATADNQADIYLDGDLIISTPESNDQAWKQKYSYSVTPLRKGDHVLAAEVFNPDRGPVIPAQNVVSSIIPAYANDSNKYYIGAGYTDGDLGPYVDAAGGVGGHYGYHAFDGNAATYWLSVGNYLEWSSDFEWIEGTFSARRVTAVTVTAVNGPYLCYVSFRLGSGGWWGTQTIPYVSRTVNTGANIPYSTYAWVQANAQTVIYLPEAVDADRVRFTFHNLYDFGIGKYRWRAGVAEVSVTSESLLPEQGNYAGFLLTMCNVDTQGNVTGISQHTDTTHWLCKRTPRPGWMAQHILHQLMIEAEDRGVFGASALSLGFTPTVDSNGQPWNLPRQELSYNIGADLLSVVGSLVETDNFDVWVDSETMTLHAAQTRGFNMADGDSPLALREGQSLVDFNAETTAPKATRYLVETPWGWTEVAAPEMEITVGRFERLMSLGNAASVDQAKQQAQSILGFTAKESTSVTAAHTDSLGPRAYSDYRVGDWILAPDTEKHPPPAYNALVPYRVLSISAAEDEAGNVIFTPELDKEELQEP